MPSGSRLRKKVEFGKGAKWVMEMPTKKSSRTLVIWEEELCNNSISKPSRRPVRDVTATNIPVKDKVVVKDDDDGSFNEDVASLKRRKTVLPETPFRYSRMLEEAANPVQVVPPEEEEMVDARWDSGLVGDVGHGWRNRVGGGLGRRFWLDG